jgi:hypothetical protein
MLSDVLTLQWLPFRVTQWRKQASPLCRLDNSRRLFDTSDEGYVPTLPFEENVVERPTLLI